MTDLVCAIIRSGADPLTHELYPAFRILFQREHGRTPSLADLYDSARCPCCF
ncbi:hypothetical protein [Streptomyces prasinosporus]|uniref:hypothetical protein n=1 Tax=Streptomyces prasinosporus TaxID=68256 RepID=UPI0031E7AED2